MASKTEKMTFEEVMQRLEEISSELESGKATLDRSLALYTEGVKLIKSANTMLDNAEKKVAASKVSENESE